MTVSQAVFRAALLDPDRPIPAGLSDGDGQPAAARFNVYRNNVAVSLIEALRTGFPILTKLLGQQNMDGLSRQYLRANPPSSPLMMHYGQRLPDYLGSLPQLAHLGYLPDVARLELALRRSYHAADSTPISPTRLAVLDPDALMAATVTLAPAVGLLRSDWPLYDIWRFNTQEDAPKPAHVAQDVLITRPEFDPSPHALPSGGAAWIQALLGGQTLAAALHAAQTEAADFDPTETLTLMLSGNAMISLTQEV
ncbi:HvfC/BufC N-terminal domain-containing protein [Sedimentitalea nanhaiensis]|uniref:Putative DNA-binding domain-containing protein n=1 Tax=Sedimentitalea nanhaiensis TaxID=999627 RepID=A0A1I6ZG56_9RHOB|nr:DNA-binding domain-containing protein [Sedimentitalea nanhaiensis]SFT61647.1 Putative DNA-binding domain-containing protein [Sedimentitalea nanhaiensis]